MIVVLSVAGFFGSMAAFPARRWLAGRTRAA
jgi:hypothetical protein